MLNKQTTLYLYRGASSVIEFDFSDFEFASNSKCVFTISSLCNKEEVFSYEFTQAELYEVLIRDDITINLKDNQYKYNIMYILNGERYPQCADSDVIVRNVVNPYAAE